MLTPRDTASLHRLMTMLNDPEEYKRVVSQLITKQEDIERAMKELEDKRQEVDRKVATFQSVVEQVAADKKQMHMQAQSYEKTSIDIQNKTVELTKHEARLDKLNARLVNQERDLNVRSGKLFDAEAAIVRRESLLVDQERMMQAKLAQLSETETTLANRMERLRTFVAAPV